MTARNKRDKQASVSTSEKRMSQWEDLMRKFSRAHQEKCRLRPANLNIPRTFRSTKYFPTGSQYGGSWDVLGMSGRGIYTFPNGVVYDGEFEDGMFHGKGQLRYEDGTTLKGQFYKGVMIERKLTFADGLEYEEEDWMYCKMPDRRFAVEYDRGLQPAGRSFITPNRPPREIPRGFYDAGDGFYNPITKSVYNPEDPTAILRSPAELEQKWIIENCRVCPDPVLGPRQHLYEKWSEPQEKLPPIPKPAADLIKGQMSSRQPSVYSEEGDLFRMTEYYDPAKFGEPDIPVEWSRIKRPSSISDHYDASKIKTCENIKARSRAQYGLTAQSGMSNADNASIAARSSHNCFPSSIMMYIVEEDDRDFFDATSVRFDFKSFSMSNLN